jgi:predicted nuclease with TOPRIM domain
LLIFNIIVFFNKVGSYMCAFWVTNSIEVRPERVHSAAQAYKLRKTEKENLQKSINLCQERIESFSNNVTKLEDKIKLLKERIQPLKLNKDVSDNQKTWVESIARIMKIVALIIGYISLGLISIGILPLIFENSTDNFKKVYHGKIGYQILKIKDEVKEIKNQLKDLKNQKLNDEDFIKRNTVYQKSLEELHALNFNHVQKEMEQLKVEQDLLQSKQTFIIEKIKQEPNNSILHKDLGEASNSLSSKIEWIAFVKKSYEM